jgi:GNAT superfamily N-acetyltransferase
MSVTVRPARVEDGPALREIERLAGRRFRDVGLPDVADAEPPALGVLARYATGERCWVAVDDGDRPIGYVLVDRVDGNAHIEQMSVRPDRQGAGVGRTLLECVRSWSVDRAMTAVTLTTFRDVPWNAPLYRHLGFRVLAGGEIGPELQAIRDAEARHGLDPAARVCMRLEVAGGHGDRSLHGGARG